MTATVETVSEQLDLAAIIPAEKVVTAVARAITLSESDVGKIKYFYHVYSSHSPKCKLTRIGCIRSNEK